LNFKEALDGETEVLKMSGVVSKKKVNIEVVLGCEECLFNQVKISRPTNIK